MSISIIVSLLLEQWSYDGFSNVNCIKNATQCVILISFHSIKIAKNRYSTKPLLFVLFFSFCWLNHSELIVFDKTNLNYMHRERTWIEIQANNNVGIDKWMTKLNQSNLRTKYILAILSFSFIYYFFNSHYFKFDVPQ